MKYRKCGITGPKGFGVPSKEAEDKMREQSCLMVLGYGKWVDWSDLESDTLNFVQQYWEEGNHLFETLSEGKVLDALTQLRNGPWSATDLARMLPELDHWAMLMSAERAVLGPMNERIIRTITNEGVETYYGALLEKHAESVEATEDLQRALEELGLELWDTGAMYSPEGLQEGPRDLVMGVPDTETEYAFRIYHAPRKAEYEGTLPEEVAAAVKQWEVAQ